MKKTLCLMMLCALMTHVSADAVGVLVIDKNTNRTKTAWCEAGQTCDAFQTNTTALEDYRTHLNDINRRARAGMLAVGAICGGVIFAFLTIYIIRRPQRWNNA